MKILIYGVGRNFREYELYIREQYEIVGFIDSAKEKQGTYYCGLEIKGIDSINEYEDIDILITPNTYAEIRNELIMYGITKDRILVLHDIMENVSNAKVRVLFYLDGGLGDKLIAYNYVYCWRKHYEKFSGIVDVCCENGVSVLKGLGNYSEIIDNIFLADDFVSFWDEYDLVISIRRYPKVVKCNENKICQKGFGIIEFLNDYNMFMRYHPSFFYPGLVSDKVSSDYEIARGKKRFCQPDISDKILLNTVFEVPVNICRNKLIKYGLFKKEYITIHRGCDKRYFGIDNVKLWEEKNYRLLISDIKHKYPQYVIVLVGENYEKSEVIDNADIDLVGKTDCLELLSILKYSCLHVDTEGGLVHLRHAVCGNPSIVLFGPTNPAFFGYEENVNLRTSDCDEPCEWKVNNWENNCINIRFPHICMKSISPKLVLENIERRELL